MKHWILFKTNLIRYRLSVFGVFAMSFIIFTCLATALTIQINSNTYIKEEISRLHFGDLTAWVNHTSDDMLQNQFKSIQEIASYKQQPVVFSNYMIKEHTSDSEGQLIPYQADEYRYRFFNDQLSGYMQDDIVIESKEIYISPSLLSSFSIAIGDEIQFQLARGNKSYIFTVKGFFEDPFMGSSMIGMKSFLIAQDEYEEIRSFIASEGINALARTGSMMHIFQNPNSNMNNMELNQYINESTNIKSNLEFMHSNEAITQYMLILQNSITGLLLAFAGILFVVTLLIIVHTIYTTIEQSVSDLAILKGIGVFNRQLRMQQVILFLFPTLLAFAFALPISTIVNRWLNLLMISVSGVRIPSDLPYGILFVLFVMYLIIMGFVVILKTKKITTISPIAMLQNTENQYRKTRQYSPLLDTNIHISLAVRQVRWAPKRYLSVVLIAMLLTFTISSVFRINIWLGKNGEGMMKAFNPADHDIGIQQVNEMDKQEMISVINRYTQIQDEYLLAMPSVNVNGIDMTANVINEPNRFLILKGRTIQSKNEVVVTESLSKDLNINIGDTIQISKSESREYLVVGIYQCANDMGQNIGLSEDGYFQIGEADENFWCTHYFLKEPSLTFIITQALQEQFGSSIYIHENTWPGLIGIVVAMRIVIVVMQTIVALFIFIVTQLIATKLLSFEQKDMGIFKAIGFQERYLRISFVIRFLIGSSIGCILGIVLSICFNDRFISMVLKTVGIGNFKSDPSFIMILMPMIYIVFLFCLFAFLVSRKIKKMKVIALIS